MIRRIVNGVDIVVFAALAACALVLAAPVAGLLRVFTRRPKPTGQPVFLTIQTGASEAAARRNVGAIYRASPLNGYFAKCIFLFYLSDRSGQSYFQSDILLIDFRSLWADGLRAKGFVWTSRFCQEILFLAFSVKLIQRESVCLMQANDPFIQGLHTLWLSWATRIPYVVRVVCDYDHYYEKFKRLAFPVLKWRIVEKIMERVVFACADGVIPWTQNYRRFALTNGAAVERTEIIPAFVDPRFFEPPAVLPHVSTPFDLQNTPLLLYLGRLSWDKYCLDLVDVVAEIAEKIPNVRLVILGDGEQKQEFLAKAKVAGVSEHIYLAGTQSVEQIIAWAKKAQVMLAPHAGFSLVELGAVGLPVVAYDYEWHSELVKNDETGFCVPFRDAHAMAEKAVFLLENPKIAQEMRDRLRERTRAEHHPDLVGRQMQRYFQTVIEKVSLT